MHICHSADCRLYMSCITCHASPSLLPAGGAPPAARCRWYASCMAGRCPWALPPSPLSWRASAPACAPRSPSNSRGRSQSTNARCELVCMHVCVCTSFSAVPCTLSSSPSARLAADLGKCRALSPCLLCLPGLQGLTLDLARVSLRNCFAEGQAYVALRWVVGWLGGVTTGTSYRTQRRRRPI
jgi:hypothetical protein